MGGAATGGVAVAEPVLLCFPDEPAVETAIHITELDGSTLITAIEFLSASNKLPGADLQRYLRKRNEYLAGGVNLVPPLEGKIAPAPRAFCGQ